jgi:hypothetical protein
MKAATMFLDPKDACWLNEPSPQNDYPGANYWIWLSMHTAVLTVGTR